MLNLHLTHDCFNHIKYAIITQYLIPGKLYKINLG